MRRHTLQKLLSCIWDLKLKVMFNFLLSQMYSDRRCHYSGFNTGYRSSEPLKTLVMLCYVSVIIIIMLSGILNLNYSFHHAGRLIFLHFFTLKYPLQNDYNTRVCYIIGSLVFFTQSVLARFLLFNPTIVNDKVSLV